MNKSTIIKVENIFASDNETSRKQTLQQVLANIIKHRKNSDALNRKINKV